MGINCDPCPRCSSQNLSIEHPGPIHPHAEDEELKEYWCITCLDCGLTGPYIDSITGIKARSIDFAGMLWNNQTPGCSFCSEKLEWISISIVSHGCITDEEYMQPVCTNCGAFH